MQYRKVVRNKIFAVAESVTKSDPVVPIQCCVYFVKKLCSFILDIFTEVVYGNILRAGNYFSLV